MMSRAERFSQSARRTLAAAQEEAEALNSSTVDTPHILLGMLRVDESLAYHVLRDMKIDYDKVLNVVRGVLPSEPTPPKSRELAPETKRLLETSLQVARQRGDQDIRSEHLLLALVKGEDKSIRYVMRQINLEPNVVRSCVERVLEEGFPPPPSADEQEATIRTTPAAMIKQTDPSNRAKVLQLVETGKISASEGAELLKAMRFSAIPVPGSGGFVLLPLEDVNFDELRQRTLHLTITNAADDGNGDATAELTIPFEQAQAMLFKLLKDMYAGAHGTLVELNGGKDHLNISME
jgi:hypothetical protein